MFSESRSQDLHRNLYKQLVTVAQAPSKLQTVTEFSERNIKIWHTNSTVK
jgi:hypothetical protein